jgi:hypothetical protein
MIADIKVEKAKVQSGTFNIDGGGTVTVQLLQADALKAMNKACFTTSVEYPLLEDPVTGKKEYRRFEVPKFDSDLWNEMLWDRVIVGWENILDVKERPIPVTKEFKVLLMSEIMQMEDDTPVIKDGKTVKIPKVPAFSNAVNAGLKVLRETESKEAEVKEKN